MDKNIFAGSTLNKAVPLGAVEPLHCSLLSHKHNSFRLNSRNEFSSACKQDERTGCCFTLQISPNKKGQARSLNSTLPATIC